jgi:integrase
VIHRGLLLQDEVTVSELYEQFIARRLLQCEEGKFSPITLKRYRQIFQRYIQPAFGRTRVRDLKRGDVTDAYDRWLRFGCRGRRVCARTVLHAHDLLRAILNWGVKRELATRNVAALLTSDELPRALKPTTKALSEAELQTLLSAAQEPTKRARSRGTVSSQPWFYPAHAFAAYTGCRRGETLAIRWCDVDFEAATATICRSIAEPGDKLVFKSPKNGKTRTIVIPPTLVNILTVHRDVQNAERREMRGSYTDHGLVFALADGSPVLPSAFGAAFKRLVRRCGVTDITLHDLRDTHASLLAKAGVPIEVVSQRLGHCGIGITVDRYLHVYRERDAHAAAAFEKLLAG